MLFVNICVHKKFTLKRDLKDGCSQSAFSTTVKDAGMDQTVVCPQEPWRQTGPHPSGETRRVKLLLSWGSGEGFREYWSVQGLVAERCHRCSEGEGPRTNPLINQNTPPPPAPGPSGANSPQTPQGRGVLLGLPGGQHSRPFLQLCARHRHLILEMHFWENIFSGESRVETYCF